MGPEPGRELTVGANGLRFTGRAWGDGATDAGRPTVLCLHGFPQRSTSWSAVADRLAAQGLRAVAIDQRGYSPGARPTDVAAYALPHLVADAVGVIEALGAPVHLAGHDWGGVVGWQVAARRPDLVRSWTAVSTPEPRALAAALEQDPEQRARFGYMATFRRVGVAERALLANGGAALRELYQGRVDPCRIEDDVAFFAEPGVLTAALSWYRAMSAADGRDLPMVGVPTSFVWGSADVAFGAVAAGASGEHVTGPYRFCPLEGAGHWLPDEAPDAVADAVLAAIGMAGEE